MSSARDKIVEAGVMLHKIPTIFDEESLDGIATNPAKLTPKSD
jgi:hypothetical protein